METSITQVYKTIVGNRDVAPFTAKDEQGQLAQIDQERENQLSILEHDYQSSKKQIQLRAEVAKKELTWMRTLASLENEDSPVHSIELLKKEAEIVDKITIANVKHSSSIRYWRKHMSENELISSLSIIFKRFLGKLKVKDNMTDGEIISLCVKIIFNYPNTKLAELIYILNKVATGGYVVNNFKIDETEFFKWVDQFNAEDVQQRESDYYATKTTGTNAGFADDSKEKREKYKQDKLMKAEVDQEVKDQMKSKQESKKAMGQ